MLESRRAQIFHNAELSADCKGRGEATWPSWVRRLRALPLAPPRRRGASSASSSHSSHSSLSSLASFWKDVLRASSRRASHGTELHAAELHAEPCIPCIANRLPPRTFAGSDSRMPGSLCAIGINRAWIACVPVRTASTAYRHVVLRPANGTGSPL